MIVSGQECKVMSLIVKMHFSVELYIIYNLLHSFAQVGMDSWSYQRIRFVLYVYVHGCVNSSPLNSPIRVISSLKNFILILLCIIKSYYKIKRAQNETHYSSNRRHRIHLASVGDLTRRKEMIRIGTLVEERFDILF